ncbi:hypothetical protein DFH09DRAFT_1402717 [Mycena vulgaris]|nr:hypothetical protein DFH09DRAFT_1402717 [Mycena vulgaris]
MPAQRTVPAPAEIHGNARSFPSQWTTLDSALIRLTLATLDYDDAYWRTKLPPDELKGLTLKAKLHLVFSLMVFLSISTRQLLHWLFTTDIPAHYTPSSRILLSLASAPPLALPSPWLSPIVFPVLLGTSTFIKLGHSASLRTIGALRVPLLPPTCTHIAGPFGAFLGGDSQLPSQQACHPPEHRLALSAPRSAPPAAPHFGTIFTSGRTSSNARCIPAPPCLPTLPASPGAEPTSSLFLALGQLAGPSTLAVPDRGHTALAHFPILLHPPQWRSRSSPPSPAPPPFVAVGPHGTSHLFC